MLRHFFQKVLQVVVRIGAIGFCCLDKGIHDDRGFGSVRCVAEQPVAAPHAQIFEAAFTESVIDGDMRVFKKLPDIDLQLKLTQVLRGKLTHLSGGVVSK